MEVAWAAPATIVKARHIRINAKKSIISAVDNSIVYLEPHMSADNGATVDGDELRFNFVNNSLQNAVVTGNVKAFVPTQDPKQNYTIFADKAVYYPEPIKPGVVDPETGKVMLYDHVKLLMASFYTQGPAVQTGDSAEIRLGNGKKYPYIIMNNVDADFTPQQ
jgi:hypothetical protein